MAGIQQTVRIKYKKDINLIIIVAFGSSRRPLFYSEDI